MGLLMLAVSIIGATMKPEISEELEWVRMFLEVYQLTTPGTDCIYQVRALTPKPFKFHSFVAQISEMTDSTYILEFYLGYYNYKWSRKGVVKPVWRPYSIIEILQYLAHELAHLGMVIQGVDLKCGYHTNEHDTLKSWINLMFNLILDDTNYVSEEHETKFKKDHQGQSFPLEILPLYRNNPIEQYTIELPQRKGL